ncbi:NUDIX domain-containing protein [Paenibacillus filicis]|uniref:NUDIX domain-containing protein n=1 Tax=Paenibacillus gyeongsangnamensis TaxID=3388067 RepID=A0ABT4QGN0_9BACL|nr:NUDIX domain-containing protein [Paenibacillus filicis]MCZ8516014.1 NUDIX domain-containing protein [Paenibacillus filicis]
MTPSYCMKCGQPLESRSVGGSDRLACTGAECDFVHWGNYSIGVGALVVREGKVLLVRRAIEPGKGNWTNPGGYIEQREPIEETIVREVFEESGVTAAVKRIVALRDQPRDVHNVYIAFLMDYVDGDPVPDGVETDGAGFFSLEEMKEMQVANFTKWLVDIAFHRTAAGGGLRQDSHPVAPLNGTGFATW